MRNKKLALIFLLVVLGLNTFSQPNVCFRSHKDIQQLTNFTPGAIVNGDFNIDSYDDLGVLTGTNQLVVYQGGNSLIMTPTYTINVSSNSNVLLYDNFNSDSFKDLIVANNDTLYLLLHNGINGFQNPVPYKVNNPISSILSGDFNNDNNLDLMVGYSSGGNIYLGSAAGIFSFSNLNPQIPLSPSSPDLNNDGYDDIVGIMWTNPFPPNIYSSICIFTCTPNVGLNASISFTVPGCYGSVETSDLNSDGMVDIVYYDALNQSLYTFTNTGQNSFSLCQDVQNINTYNSNSSRIKIVDYNNDNIQDLIIKGYLFFDGLGSGKFKQPQGLESFPFFWDNCTMLNTPNPLNKKVAVFTPQLHLYNMFSGVLKPYIPLLTFMSPTVSSVFNFGNLISDVDKDGNMDIISARDSNIVLFNGNGGGNFDIAKSYNAGKTVNGLLVEDINNDNFPDYIVYNSGNTINTFLGSSNFSLTLTGTLSAGAINNKIICKDFDNDGIKDLLSYPSLNSITFFKGNGNGTFNGATSTSSTFSISGMFSSDFNNDSYPDLLITNDTNIYIRQNNGAGFNPPIYVGSFWFSYFSNVYLADLTNDSIIDFMTYNGTIMKSFIGNGNFTFTSVITPTAPPAFGICEPLTDFNGDNFPDVLITSYFSSYIQTGIGNGNFNNPIPLTIETHTATNVRAGDFNNDEIPDLVFNNGNSATAIFDKSVFLNYTAIIRAPFSTTLCNSTSVNLKTAKDAFNYSWFPNINGTDSVTYSAAGIKSLTITSQNGNCVSTNTILIANLTPTVSLFSSTDTACVNSGSILLTGNPIGGQFYGANVQGNFFNPNNAGSNTASYSYTNSAGCSANAQTTIIVNACNSLAELPLETFILYPNPTRDFIYFSNFITPFDIQLFSSTGQLIIASRISREVNSIDLSKLKHGLYVVKFLNTATKIIKE